MLIKGIVHAFFNYFNLHDRTNNYTPCLVSNRKVFNRSSFSRSTSIFAQPTPPSVNAQRIAYFSGSSNIYLG